MHGQVGDYNAGCFVSFVSHPWIPRLGSLAVQQLGVGILRCVVASGRVCDDSDVSAWKYMCFVLD